MVWSLTALVVAEQSLWQCSERTPASGCCQLEHCAIEHCSSRSLGGLQASVCFDFTHRYTCMLRHLLPLPCAWTTATEFLPDRRTPQLTLYVC